MMSMSIERLNERPGTPPSSIWTSVEMDQDKHLVCCIGMSQTIERIVQRLRSPIRRFPARLPYVNLYVQDNDGKIPLAILFVGTWPDFEQAKMVVRTISGEAGSGPPQWCRRLRKVAKEHADHMASASFRLPEDDVKMLAKVYLDECRHALKLGQA